MLTEKKLGQEIGETEEKKEPKGTAENGEKEKVEGSEKEKRSKQQQDSTDAVPILLICRRAA